MVIAISWLKAKDPASISAMLSLPIQILHLFLLVLFLLSQPFEVRAGGSIPPSNVSLSDPAFASSSKPITLVSPPSGAVFLAGLSLPVLWILNVAPTSSPTVNDTLNNTLTTTSTDAYISTTSTYNLFPITTSTFDTSSSTPTDIGTNGFETDIGIGTNGFERRSDPTNLTINTTNAALDIYLTDGSQPGAEPIQLATGVDANAEFWSFSVPPTQKFSKWYYIVVHLYQSSSAIGVDPRKANNQANETVLTAGPFTILDRSGNCFFLTGPDPGQSGKSNVMGMAGKTFTVSWYSEVPWLNTVDIVLNSTLVGGGNMVIASGVDIDVGRYAITSDMLSGMANGTYWLTLYAQGQGNDTWQPNWWARDGPYRVGGG